MNFSRQKEFDGLLSQLRAFESAFFGKRDKSLFDSESWALKWQDYPDTAHAEYLLHLEKLVEITKELSNAAYSESQKINQCAKFEFM